MEHDVFRCPSCNQAFLKNTKYNNSGLVCAACKCSVKKTNDKTEQAPLLTIELQDESSVPKVFYKGEEVKLKQHVFFDWDTDTDVYGGLSYALEHIVTGEKYPVTNRIERRVKGHATT